MWYIYIYTCVWLNFPDSPIWNLPPAMGMKNPKYFSVAVRSHWFIRIYNYMLLIFLPLFVDITWYYMILHHYPPVIKHGNGKSAYKWLHIGYTQCSDTQIISISLAIYHISSCIHIEFALHLHRWWNTRPLMFFNPYTQTAQIAMLDECWWYIQIQSKDVHQA